MKGLYVQKRCGVQWQKYMEREKRPMNDRKKDNQKNRNKRKT